MGEITAAQEKAFLDDNWNKTVYEMDNMFKSTNRATYGKFATFQPALCEEDLINSPTSMLITVDRLNDALDYLRSVDYSLFYHEIVFSDPDHGITKETKKLFSYAKKKEIQICIPDNMLKRRNTNKQKEADKKFEEEMQKYVPLF